jgi:hypothetical protein
MKYLRKAETKKISKLTPMYLLAIFSVLFLMPWATANSLTQNQANLVSNSGIPVVSPHSGNATTTYHGGIQPDTSYTYGVNVTLTDSSDSYQRDWAVFSCNPGGYVSNGQWTNQSCEICEQAEYSGATMACNVNSYHSSTEYYYITVSVPLSLAYYTGSVTMYDYKVSSTTQYCSGNPTCAIYEDEGAVATNPYYV